MPLRDAISLGADRVRLVTPESDGVTVDSAASALAAHLHAGTAFDLILGGSSGSSDEEGLLARLTAEALADADAGEAAQIVIQASADDAEIRLYDADGRSTRVRNLPAFVAIEPGLTLRTYSVTGYLEGLGRGSSCALAAQGVGACRHLRRPRAGSGDDGRRAPTALTPGAGGAASSREARTRRHDDCVTSFEGDIRTSPVPPCSIARMVIASSPASPTVACTRRNAVVRAARQMAGQAASAVRGAPLANLAILLLAPPREESQRRAVAQLLEAHASDVVVLATGAGEESPEVRARVLGECWPEVASPTAAVVGEAWCEAAFAMLGSRPGKPGRLALRVRRVSATGDAVVLETSRARGKLTTRHFGSEPRRGVAGGGAEVEDAWPASCRTAARAALSSRLNASTARRSATRSTNWGRKLGSPVGRRRVHPRCGFGIGNRDGFEEVIEPLEKALKALNVRSLMIGGSRKVTEELHLLPADRQIGQSGVSVNPQVLLAIGVSGAPQHLNYIGPRATILAFNRDPDAPLMTLNQRQPRPKVFPIVGDLFETVPALTAALQEERSGQSDVSPAPSAERMETALSKEASRNVE